MRDIRPIIDVVVADNPKRVTVDIEELTMIDSSGVGAIVLLFKRIKTTGGEVVIVHAQSSLSPSSSSSSSIASWD